MALFVSPALVIFIFFSSWNNVVLRHAVLRPALRQGRGCVGVFGVLGLAPLPAVPFSLRFPSAVANLPSPALNSFLQAWCTELGNGGRHPGNHLAGKTSAYRFLLSQLLALAAPCRGSALLGSPHLVELFAVAAPRRFGSLLLQITEIPSDNLGEQCLIAVLSLPSVSSSHGLLFIGEAVPKIAFFLALS